MSENLDSLTDEALAKIAQGGNRAAFDILCERYLPCVYNRLRAMLPLDVVEDVTQEVFMAAMQGIGRYRAKSLFRTWLTAIARHKVADYYRRQGRRPEGVPFDGEIHNTSSSDNWEEHALVRLALYRLPSHYQEVLLLRFSEGMPFAQIADTLGISLEATKSRYRRAVAAAAREMDVERKKDRSP